MAVVVFDHELKIIDSNPAAVKLLPAGDELPDLLIGATPPNGDSWHNLFQTILHNNQTRSFEQVTCQHPQRDLILKLICIPMLQEDRSPSAGGYLIAEDVTREALVTRDLANAERLAALGKLSSKVAHELNNPLDGIIRYLNLGIRLAQQQENLTLIKYLKESHHGLLRMVRILSDMLDFSREARSSSEHADVNKLLEDAVRMLELKAEEFDIEIVRDLQEPMPNIRSGNLFQVFCNLIKNAIDAMPDGGRIVLATETNDTNMIVTCSDQGSGIDQNLIDRVFEPFFTTKETGKGTGLGLPICRDIIERYGGRLTVANNPDRGCTFTITIPLDQTSWANGQSEMSN